MDNRSAERMRNDAKMEMNFGLAHPNRGDCDFAGNGCPEEVQDNREEGLLMLRCSNNYTLKGCRMYRFLERRIGAFRYHGGYNALVEKYEASAVNVRRYVDNLRKGIEGVASSILGKG